jgi:hypothetical protein
MEFAKAGAQGLDQEPRETAHKFCNPRIATKRCYFSDRNDRRALPPAYRSTSKAPFGTRAIGQSAREDKFRVSSSPNAFGTRRGRDDMQSSAGMAENTRLFTENDGTGSHACESSASTREVLTT